jgi:dTDP-4-amino-4,6-dideoxygalactose transaminase
MPNSVITSLERALFSGFINEGTQVAEFEQRLREWLGNSLTMATNSCTGSLTLALRLAGVGPGDEVLSTPMTCVATNMPIKNLFARPVWCDVNPDNGTIDPDEIERKVTKKTKAVVVVDWTGIPAELDRIKSVARGHGIKVVEDAAQAFGAFYKGRKIGCISDFTCFSFQAIKHISTGDGGALAVLDEQDFVRGRKLKWFGIDREATKDSAGNWRGSRWDSSIPEAGYKFHMNNVAAAIGVEQMKCVDAILRAHTDNAQYYMRELKGIPGLTLPEIPEDVKPAWWVFMLFAERRDDLSKRLAERGIDSSLLHIRNDVYECFEESRTHLPNVTKFQNRELCIPCGWWVSREDREYIVEMLREGW